MKHTPSNEIREGFIIGTTVLLALILTLLPMPHWLVGFRPVWVLLVLTFWSLILPGRVSITLAWIVGILLDVLNGTLLGEHALALIMVIYVVARLSSQLRMFSLFQQGISVFFMVLFYQFILFCIQGFLGSLPDGWLYWLPAFTSMLLWPWAFIIMRDWYHRFEN
jgi:rod shape-determining protein MreD